MSIIDTNFRTVTCNGPNCNKTITFNMQEQDKEKAQAVFNDNPWLKTLRIVQASGKNFAYCSDTCEVESVTLGTHNPPEERKIIPIDGGGRAQIREAAAAAAAAAEASRAIKAGENVTLNVQPANS